MDEQRTTVVRESDTSVADNGANRAVVTNSASKTETVGATLAARIVRFITGVIVAFLALRFVLLLLGANQGNAFVDFVYAVGGAFAAPFFGIFGYTPVYGQFVFEVSTLVAIAIYALIGWGIAKLLTLNRPNANV